MRVPWSSPPRKDAEGITAALDSQRLREEIREGVVVNAGARTDPMLRICGNVSFLSLQNLSLAFFLVFKLCKHLKTLFTYYYSACLSVHAYEHVCLERHVEARGKLCRVGFLLPPFRGIQGSNSGCQAFVADTFPRRIILLAPISTFENVTSDPPIS